MSEKNIQSEGQDSASLDDFKEAKVTFSPRAPNAGDKGRMWITYTAGSAVMSLYLRNPLTGAWTKPT